MPNVPGGNQGLGNAGEDLQGPVSPEVVAAGTVSVHQAWHNLCVRLATWSPKVVQDGARYLDKVDRITGLTSKRVLP